MGDDVYPPGDEAELELADGLVLVADVEDLWSIDLLFLRHGGSFASRASATARHTRYIAFILFTIYRVVRERK